MSEQMELKEMKSNNWIIPILCTFIGTLLGLLIAIGSMKPDLEVYKSKCDFNKQEIEAVTQEYKQQMGKIDEKLDNILLQLKDKEDRK